MRAAATVRRRGCPHRVAGQVGRPAGRSVASQNNSGGPNGQPSRCGCQLTNISDLDELQRVVDHRSRRRLLRLAAAPPVRAGDRTSLVSVAWPWILYHASASRGRRRSLASRRLRPLRSSRSPQRLVISCAMAAICIRRRRGRSARTLARPVGYVACRALFGGDRRGASQHVPEQPGRRTASSGHRPPPARRTARRSGTTVDARRTMTPPDAAAGPDVHDAACDDRARPRQRGRRAAAPRRRLPDPLVRGVIAPDPLRRAQTHLSAPRLQGAARPPAASSSADWRSDQRGRRRPAGARTQQGVVGLAALARKRCRASANRPPRLARPATYARAAWRSWHGDEFAGDLSGTPTCARRPSLLDAASIAPSGGSLGWSFDRAGACVNA
jgi:hypothetical protein